MTPPSPLFAADPPLLVRLFAADPRLLLRRAALVVPRVAPVVRRAALVVRPAAAARPDPAFFAALRGAEFAALREVDAALREVDAA